MMSLFGVTEQGFSQIKIGAKPEIWATACAIPTCSTSTSGQRSLHRRRRPEPLGGDQLPARFVEGRRELAGHNQASMPSPQGTRRKLRNRRPPVGEYPHEEPYPGAEKLKTVLAAPAQRLGVANYAGLEDLPGRRLVLRTALRRRLGQEREQVADAGVPADAAAVHGRKRRG